ncbi:uncharacterized protein LODBEIA_P09020 [Lodderomyces beijingensis]|uniref:Uncharacterized protein n=1 Tax=Lodderomyces beijingensis TaxID=1775926 RepID=A0ABP0ZGG4_9ASCO
MSVDIDTNNNKSGVRYDRLKLVGQRAVERVLNKSLTADQVNSCYKDIANTELGPEVLNIGTSQLRTYLNEEALAEFDQIYEENDLFVKLNELDEIIEAAQSREVEKSEAPESQPVFFDHLSPSQVIDAITVSKSEGVLSRMREVYFKLVSENDELAETLRGFRDHADSVSSDIQNLLGLIKDQADSVQAGPVDIDDILQLKDSESNQ